MQSPSSSIGSTGGHSKRQRREPPAGLDGIEEDRQVLFDADAVQFDMASFHAAQASTPRTPRASRGDESVTSGVSNWSRITEAPPNAPELFYRYLTTESGLPRVTNPGGTIESAWIEHCAQPGFEPSDLDISDAIGQMSQSPRSSAILQMGRRVSQANLHVLHDLATNSQTRAETAKNKAKEAFEQRTWWQDPMNRAKEQYLEAKETFENWERKVENAVTVQQHQEKLHAEHHRRQMVCRGLIPMMKAIVQDGSFQIFSNLPMAQVRERLGFSCSPVCIPTIIIECDRVGVKGDCIGIA